MFKCSSQFVIRSSRPILSSGYILITYLPHFASELILHFVFRMCLHNASSGFLFRMSLPDFVFYIICWISLPTWSSGFLFRIPLSDSSAGLVFSVIILNISSTLIFPISLPEFSSELFLPKLSAKDAQPLGPRQGGSCFFGVVGILVFQEHQHYDPCALPSQFWT